MHRLYFPACPVEGPIEPAQPFAHMGSSGAVPLKCSRCEHLFEGSCVRFMGELGAYRHLDHGPCGVPGPTDPVEYEDSFIQSKVQIPRKCARCPFLAVDRIFGFHCTKDKKTWGDFHRGLDWGAWAPDTVYLQLPLPKVTTKALSQHAKGNDLVAFVAEYRRSNPGLSIAEARTDFARFRRLLGDETPGT